MKARVLLMFVAAGLFVGATGCGSSAASCLAVKVGDKLPTWTAKTVDGGKVALTLPRDKPLVLDFGASWCGPCRKEFPMLSKSLQARDGSFDILTVKSQDSNALMDEFAKKVGVTWPVADGDPGELATKYGVRGLPATFFADKSGKLVGCEIGEFGQSELDDHLDAIGA